MGYLIVQGENAAPLRENIIGCALAAKGTNALEFLVCYLLCAPLTL